MSVIARCRGVRLRSTPGLPISTTYYLTNLRHAAKLSHAHARTQQIPLHAMAKHRHSQLWLGEPSGSEIWPLQPGKNVVLTDCFNAYLKKNIETIRRPVFIWLHAAVFSVFGFNVCQYILPRPLAVDRQACVDSLVPHWHEKLSVTSVSQDCSMTVLNLSYSHEHALARIITRSNYRKRGKREENELKIMLCKISL